MGRQQEEEAFVAGVPGGPEVLDRVRVLVERAGGAEERVSRSQVAFRRRRGFAYLWRPGQYLANSGADLVLSIALGRQVDSPRFKQVVRVSSLHWMHHLEVGSAADLDDEVAGWVAEAAARAGEPG